MGYVPAKAAMGTGQPVGYPISSMFNPSREKLGHFTRPISFGGSMLIPRSRWRFGATGITIATDQALGQERDWQCLEELDQICPHRCRRQADSCFCSACSTALFRILL